ncbi:Fungalysin metallopeptidase-domain-containing protein [Globomyces pollinis-pini]|nr:Fungalysin metallopeptidase-domain-containing protein [Globomyces pollinis-pini]
MQHKIIAAFTLALASQAAPTAPLSHDLQFVKRNGLSTPFYYPKPIAKSFPVNHAIARSVSATDVEKIALEALSKEFSLNASELKIAQSHTDAAGVTHIYALHTINGVSVDNHNCAVHIKNGKVISISSSFTGELQKRDLVSAPVVAVPLEEAVAIATKEFGVPRDDQPAKMVYVQVPSGKLVYAHQIQLQNEDSSKFYQVSVAADNGQIVQVVDFVSKVSYKVIALPNNDPRDGFSTVTDPADKKASPEGWHKDTKPYTDTQGNNAISAAAKTTVNGGESLSFGGVFDSFAAPTSEGNKQAATVNSFYLVNTVHDIAYQYGFDEASGNFQNNNFGKGGKGNDRVKINNQAGGTNNANFATPPDGQSGVMNMYRFTMTTPNRDGSLDNGIPIHEFTHGISNRLTGGSAQGNCLQTNESGGMGEGWSDTVAMFLERKSTNTRADDYTTGSYVVDKPAGIRSYPYSTDMKTNPYTYNDLNSKDEVHDIGEVWATILNEVYWNLVDAHGYDSNWLNATQQKGNIMAMQLVIGGMKIQPCNPTFLQARDAILKTDETFYKGVNKCLIWKGFAKRGMGVKASDKDGFKADTSIPGSC